MKISEENPIISKPNNHYLLRIIESIFWLGIYALVFQQSIINASWWGLLISLFFLFSGVIRLLFFHKRIYHFYEDKIVIETHKNEYLDEIDVNDIAAWNEEINDRGKDGIDTSLIICTETRLLIIDKNDYKNYSEFIDYLNRLNLPIDKNLKSTGTKEQEEIITSSEKRLISLIISLFILIPFVFWLIVRTKVESEEKLYFTSQISKITFAKHDVELELYGYPTIRFITSDKNVFKTYNYNYGNPKYVHQDKTIKLTVSKSDYDWRIKNKLIKKIQISSTAKLDIIDYEILD
ncbi:hypothetical protein [Emticicia sp. 21SJ11W-3]|uniref:hypothetical protein n=1 Tax=Emticicia sp. 21SJ11W-3 TaxID=2916755 RepID=UPI00209CCF4C|nr:hypothetical protein [Emticicia sp. 21SJ11W-3]UTA69477.1 hypothetical protein MB380_06615 [Emticicia sp. 21SJ11W-3]